MHMKYEKDMLDSISVNRDLSIRLVEPGKTAPHAAFHRSIPNEDEKDMKEIKKLKILALSGSPRVASSNTALLKAVAVLASPNVEILVYAKVKEYPIFDPDSANTNEPAVVIEFRKLVKEADGILIACPEYVHGVPGGFKNQLDWIVGSGELEGKLIALINTRERSKHAPLALVEIIKTMGGIIIEAASLTISLGTHNIDTMSILSKEEISKRVKMVVEIFSIEIQKFQSESQATSKTTLSP